MSSSILYLCVYTIYRRMGIIHIPTQSHYYTETIKKTWNTVTPFRIKAQISDLFGSYGVFIHNTNLYRKSIKSLTKKKKQCNWHYLGLRAHSFSCFKKCRIIMAHSAASLNKHKIKPSLIVEYFYLFCASDGRFRLVLSAFSLAKQN